MADLLHVETASDTTAVVDDPTPLLRARVLPPTEFDRLADAPLYPVIRGTESLVVVVERGHQIIGTWALIGVPHLEGCWIEPDARGHTAAARLLVGEMFDALQTLGLKQVITITQDARVGLLAQKLGGQPVEGQLWVIPVPERTPTPAEEDT